MNTALEEARTSAWEGGVPIGAVLVNARGHGGRHRSQSLAAGRGLRHARGDQLTAERRPEAELLPRHNHVLHAHPCNMCAGAIVHFGIIKVVYGESRNLPEDNGRELLVRYGVEPADLDLEEARRMLRAFIETKPEEWSADIGR